MKKTYIAPSLKLVEFSAETALMAGSIKPIAVNFHTVDPNPTDWTYIEYKGSQTEKEDGIEFIDKWNEDEF